MSFCLVSVFSASGDSDNVVTRTPTNSNIGETQRGRADLVTATQTIDELIGKIILSLPKINNI